MKAALREFASGMLCGAAMFGPALLVILIKSGALL
jgi:hypothetical protein